MADTIVSKATATKQAQQTPSVPSKIESADRLDWEAAIETPPVRPSGTLRIKLEYRGRAKPIPLPDPELEAE